MSLLFGNLTQDFVEFETVLGMAKSGNATAQANVPGAAAHFKHSSALDASYLVYIGVSVPPSLYVMAQIN